MAVRVRVKVDNSALAALNSEGGLIDAAVVRACAVARDRSKKILRDAGRIDTGALMQSIRSEHVRSGSGECVYRVGTDIPYAMYQHEGVQGPIYPRRARALAFKVGGKSVVVKSVRGFSGVPFVREAVESLQPGDFYP